MTLRTRHRWLPIILLFCAGVLILSVFIGAQPVNPFQAWREWRAGVPLSQSPSLSILINQRIPRTLAAALAGAGLALAGSAFQALLRNPLATPYTLGVASAGALGAWSAFILIDMGWLGVRVLGVPMAQTFAFLFAMADVLLVYLFAARRARTSPTVLLLAGVTLGMLSNSGIMLTRYLARPDRLVVMDRWLMGGVDVLGYKPIYALTLGVLPCALVLLSQAGKFDQLGFNEEIAASRGIRVGRLQLITFLAGSLMTAVIVSEVGPIGFVGLVVPHAVRIVTGSRHRLLMPVSLAAGAAFLCLCDIAARKVLPGETPIGIVTTLIGGPFFLYLLMRGKFTDWA